MTLVSDDPADWPLINPWRISSYLIVSAFVGVVYDWVLTFGQEVELVWRQRWSLMTILYLTLRYLGMFFVCINILFTVPTVLLTDARCQILYLVYNWTNVVAFPMLCVIMIARLHAMYQQSRRILIFLVVVCLAVSIFDGVAIVIATRHASGEELILSGIYVCTIDFADNALLLGSVTWILNTVWEVLALCLAVWISVKHFRELRQHSAGGIIRDCFVVLIKSHVLYFASFVAVSCLALITDYSSTSAEDSLSPQAQNIIGLIEMSTVIQSFVLGPRLILSVREYHARRVAYFDTATAMASIAFQERVHILTGSGV